MKQMSSEEAFRRITEMTNPGLIYKDCWKYIGVEAFHAYIGDTLMPFPERVVEIHELYFDKEGIAYALTKPAVIAYDTTKTNLEWSLVHMYNDLKEFPVLRHFLYSAIHFPKAKNKSYVKTSLTHSGGSEGNT